MPHFIRGAEHYPYCDEQEFLDIANKLRKAGGADILEAFMPSIPGHIGKCLIANALNFNCQVGCYFPRKRWSLPNTAVDMPIPDGYGPWAMRLLKPETAQMVANTMGWYYNPEINPLVVALPTRVGNTAAAFDRGDGWTAKYTPEDRYETYGS